MPRKAQESSPTISPWRRLPNWPRPLNPETPRLAMRLMLRCGLRVSEALQVRPSQLRFDRSPPIISLPADIVGNKAKTAQGDSDPRRLGGDPQGPRLGRDQGP